VRKQNDLGKGIATVGIWFGVAIVAIASPNMVPAYVAIGATLATLFIWS
jgi:hypothetical protein